MGMLARFDLARLIERHEIKHFVETGTGRGESLAFAARFPFRSLHSCEIEPVLAEAAKKVFASDNRIHIAQEHSDAFMAATLAVIPFQEPTLFWLDAHFPGADYGLKGYGDEANTDARLPLPRELQVIHECRPGRDLILIDDLRVWVDGPFSSGNLPASVRPFCPRRRSASFMQEQFAGTHDVAFDWLHEGYVTVTPKQLALVEVAV